MIAKTRTHRTYYLPMPQSPTKRLEVFATELAHNVLWESFGTVVPPAFNPWSHGFDLVLDKGVPGLRLNVDVAPLAVEVIGVNALVVSHLLVRVEGLVAAWDRAWHRLDGLKWDVHVGGECVLR